MQLVGDTDHGHQKLYTLRFQKLFTTHYSQQIISRKRKRQEHTRFFDNNHFAIQSAQYKPYGIVYTLLVFLQALPADATGRYGMIAFHIIAAVADGN